MYGETSTCSTQASQHNTNRSNIEYGITTLYNHKTTAQQTTSTEHNTNFIQNLASPTPFILTEQSLNNNTQPADKNSQTERPASPKTAVVDLRHAGRHHPTLIHHHTIPTWRITPYISSYNLNQRKKNNLYLANHTQHKISKQTQYTNPRSIYFHT